VGLGLVASIEGRDSPSLYVLSPYILVDIGGMPPLLFPLFPGLLARSFTRLPFDERALENPYFSPRAREMRQPRCEDSSPALRRKRSITLLLVEFDAFSDFSEAGCRNFFVLVERMRSWKYKLIRSFLNQFPLVLGPYEPLPAFRSSVSAVPYKKQGRPPPPFFRRCGVPKWAPMVNLPTHPPPPPPPSG